MAVLVFLGGAREFDVCFSFLSNFLPDQRGIARNQDKGLSRDKLGILAEFSLKSVA